MAHAEYALTGSVDGFVAYLDASITQGSLTATVEYGCEHSIGDARMVVRTYERYSALGGNRLSLTFSILAAGDQMKVSAITAGGSQAVFWKVNTFGEEAFLARADEAIRGYRG